MWVCVGGSEGEASLTRMQVFGNEVSASGPPAVRPGEEKVLGSWGEGGEQHWVC